MSDLVPVDAHPETGCAHLSAPICGCPVRTGIVVETRDSMSHVIEVPMHYEGVPMEGPPSDPDGAMIGVVYVLLTEDGARVKIGKTKSLRTRMKDAQTLSPVKLKLVAVLPGYTNVEGWFHRRFAAQRLHGEWFSCEGELAAQVSRLRVRAGVEDVAELCPEALALDGGTLPDLPEVEDRADEDALDAIEHAKWLGEQLRRADAEAGRQSLLEMFVQAWPVMRPGVELVMGPHIEALCHNVQEQLTDHFRACDDKTFVMRAQRLLINCPPRSLKSAVLIVAIVWAWTHRPTMRIAYLSTNPIVAQIAARKVRDLMTSSWYQSTYRPTWTFRSDQDSLRDTGNTAGGEMLFRGLDASITGLGFDYCVVDDPHDMKDSDAQVKIACDNYDGATGSRINDPRTSCVCAILQRYKPHDFAGHVIEQMLGGGNKWCHVRMPMEFETLVDCPCGTCGVGSPNALGWQDWRTVEGEVILPERNTPAFLDGEKVRLNSYGYAGQMQQRPTPKGGGKIKRIHWRFFRLEGDDGHALAGDCARPDGCIGGRGYLGPEIDTIVVPKVRRGKAAQRGEWAFDSMGISLDAANKKTTRGSNWGTLVVGRIGARKFVCDDVSRRGSLPEIIREVLVPLVKKWRPRKLWVEDKAAGPSAMDELTEMIQEGKLVDENGEPIAIEIVSCDPGTEDKEQRMDGQLGTIEASLVYLLDGAPWVKPFVEELEKFPAPPNDRGDALSQALAELRVDSSSNAERLRRASANYAKVFGPR